MRLSFIPVDMCGQFDRLFAKLADQAQANQLRVCGTLQTNNPIAGRDYCRVEVTLLPSYQQVRISQELGWGAGSCRLDHDALERVVQKSLVALQEGADLVLVNRFGSQESSGRGFRDLIAGAIERDIPVLIGLNDKYRASFMEFSGNFAEQLEPSTASLNAWLSKIPGAAKHDIASGGRAILS